MRNKKHSAVGKWGISLTALALAVCMLLTLAGTDIGKAKADLIDLEKKCSLTANPGDVANRPELEELSNSDVVLDLYKVADAKEVPGYDTYAFEIEEGSPYKSLETKLEGENIDYHAAAQEAAKITFPVKDGKFTQIAAEGIKVRENWPSGKTIGEKEEDKLEAGLYLLIARSPGLDAKDYVVKNTVTEKKTDGTEEKVEEIATIAYSEHYTYTFLPELIALPSKEAVEDEDIVNTANPGGWITDLTVTLKPVRGLRYGNLQIVKNITAYAAGEQASFVFQVEAEKDGERYSNVVTATADSNGVVKPILLEGVIPVGAQVTVTEIYSGVSYMIDNEENRTQTVEIPTPDNTATAVFTNEYQGTTTSGGTITNQFSYTADEGWDWKKVPNVPDLQQ